MAGGLIIDEVFADEQLARVFDLRKQFLDCSDPQNVLSDDAALDMQFDIMLRGFDRLKMHRQVERESGDIPISDVTRLKLKRCDKKLALNWAIHAQNIKPITGKSLQEIRETHLKKVDENSTRYLSLPVEKVILDEPFADYLLASALDLKKRYLDCSNPDNILTDGGAYFEAEGLMFEKNRRKYYHEEMEKEWGEIIPSQATTQKLDKAWHELDVIQSAVMSQKKRPITGKSLQEIRDRQIYHYSQDLDVQWFLGQP